MDNVNKCGKTCNNCRFYWVDIFEGVTKAALIDGCTKGHECVRCDAEACEDFKEN